MVCWACHFSCIMWLLQETVNNKHNGYTRVNPVHLACRWETPGGARRCQSPWWCDQPARDGEEGQTPSCWLIPSQWARTAPGLRRSLHRDQTHIPKPSCAAAVNKTLIMSCTVNLSLTMLTSTSVCCSIFKSSSITWPFSTSNVCSDMQLTVAANLSSNRNVVFLLHRNTWMFHLAILGLNWTRWRAGNDRVPTISLTTAWRGFSFRHVLIVVETYTYVILPVCAKHLAGKFNMQNHIHHLSRWRTSKPISLASFLLTITTCRPAWPFTLLCKTKRISSLVPPSRPLAPHTKSPFTSKTSIEWLFYH